jgi:hypothetical protein
VGPHRRRRISVSASACTALCGPPPLLALLPSVF